jgi:hypothetical protein
MIASHPNNSDAGSSHHCSRIFGLQHGVCSHGKKSYFIFELLASELLGGGDCASGTYSASSDNEHSK